VKVFRGKKVELHTHKPKRVNTDGELTTTTPAKFDVVPQAVEVFAPKPVANAAPPPAAQAVIIPPLPRGNRRLALLAAGAVACFVAVAAVVASGTPAFDEHLLRGLRTADNPAIPAGPHWLTTVVRDVTALGGWTVLSLLTLGVAGHLALRRKWAAVAAVLLAAVGGGVSCEGLKVAFARPRPAVVPHLMEAHNASFPSGHSAAAAAVLLSIAAVLAGHTSRPRARAYLFGVAVLLTLVVGVSRVYLGVHYPTDVLGGWALGTAWALLSALVARRLRRRHAG
jgi:undecaprenyl-diphosphatase